MTISEALMVAAAFAVWGLLYVGGTLASGVREDLEAEEEAVAEAEEAELLGMKCVCGVDGGAGPARREEGDAA